MKNLILLMSVLLLGSVSNMAFAGQTKYQWSGYSTMLGGSCYKVDVATGGDRFKERARVSDCRPSERYIDYVTERGSCYEVDARSTDNYSKEVDSEKCGSFATVFKWEGYSSMLGGTCYEVDVETRGEQFKERTKDRHCRPYFERDIKYVTERGSCYEVDARNTDNYSKEVDASHCGY